MLMNKLLHCMFTPIYDLNVWWLFNLNCTFLYHIILTNIGTPNTCQTNKLVVKFCQSPLWLLTVASFHVLYNFMERFSFKTLVVGNFKWERNVRINGIEMVANQNKNIEVVCNYLRLVWLLYPPLIYIKKLTKLFSIECMQR